MPVSPVFVSANVPQILRDFIPTTVIDVMVGLVIETVHDCCAFTIFHVKRSAARRRILRRGGGGGCWGSFQVIHRGK